MTDEEKSQWYREMMRRVDLKKWLIKGFEALEARRIFPYVEVSKSREIALSLGHDDNFVD
jgi:hypothetical protein